MILDGAFTDKSLEALKLLKNKTELKIENIPEWRNGKYYTLVKEMYVNSWNGTFGFIENTIDQMRPVVDYPIENLRLFIEKKENKEELINLKMLVNHLNRGMYTFWYNCKYFFL